MLLEVGAPGVRARALDARLVTAGGSAYFDLVAEELSGLPAQLVLRSGC